MTAWYRAIVMLPSWKQFFIIYIICFMALKETELTETTSGWEPRQFCCLTRATIKRRNPPPSPMLCMPRSPVWLCYSSVAGRGLRRTTRPVREISKYYPISEDVGSRHTPDDEDRISLWNVCWLEKFEVTVRMGWWLLKHFKC